MHGVSLLTTTQTALITIMDILPVKALIAVSAFRWFIDLI